MIPISLCMIVKNEEKNLGKCLDSIKDYIDEIIIADTGSTDKTKEIAYEYTDKVYHFDWVEDFSKARNYSISKANNDWIFVLDADEFIINFDRASIQNFIRKDERTVGRILRINAIAPRDQSDEEQKSLERVSRLFNKKHFHYEGRIHEQVTPIEGFDYKTEFVDISADHIGYIGCEIKDKNKWLRNKRILKESLKEKPNDTYLHYHLGKVSYLMEDYEKAISYIEQAIAIGVDYNLEYVQDMILTYGYSFLNLEQYEKGLSIIRFEPYFKNSADFYFILALMYMNKGDFTESVECFKKCLGKNETVVGTSSYLPYYNIGVIYEVLKDYKKALVFYDKCGEYNRAKTRLEEILKKQDIKGMIKGLIEKGELETAKNLISIMKKYNKKDPALYSMMGVIHIIEGDLKEAKKELEKGLEIAPGDGDLLYNLEFVDKQMGQKGKQNHRKIEIAFLPYMASMWDSMESVYLAAKKDDRCECYVVPIPYYKKKQDKSFGALNYEADNFPDYLDITHYNDYDLNQRKPDIIYFHNPYDANNRITSVHPSYYSTELKKHTNMLVYLPYFVALDVMSDLLIANPGVAYADKVIVQSELIKKLYLKVLPENRVEALGSPKIDKVINNKDFTYEIPKEWEDKIANKKLVLYNTHLDKLIRYENKAIDKLEYVFSVFEERKDAVLLWRPHPLSQESLWVIKPKLLNDYRKLIKEYKEKRIGIYDDTSDLHRAISISHGYFGDYSSLIAMYGMTGKPIIIQDYSLTRTTIKIPYLKRENKEYKMNDFLLGEREANPSTSNFLDYILSYELDVSIEQIKAFKGYFNNPDGSSGEKIHDYIINLIN